MLMHSPPCVVYYVPETVWLWRMRVRVHKQATNQPPSCARWFVVVVVCRRHECVPVYGA